MISKHNIGPVKMRIKPFFTDNLQYILTFHVVRVYKSECREGRQPSTLLLTVWKQLNVPRVQTATTWISSPLCQPACHPAPPDRQTLRNTPELSHLPPPRHAAHASLL
ncbi:hypothetical protein E2C01_020981 [Portunus trituberculatus]|uniref:Uncharacterized protein n=1 Tax=Portunus trituberculatus TaxID=210409 RepID=A0A5B7E379_PORTR|nr:hypothetical protein [Portunus trituberculatus]